MTNQSNSSERHFLIHIKELFDLCNLLLFSLKDKTNHILANQARYHETFTELFAHSSTSLTPDPKPDGKTSGIVKTA